MADSIDLTRLPGGPEPDAVIASLADLAPDRAVVVSVANLPVFCQPWGDGVLAYVNRCPHIGTPLDLIPGKIYHPKFGVFVCTTHGATFEPESGLCTGGPCMGQFLRKVLARRDGDLVRAVQAAENR